LLDRPRDTFLLTGDGEESSDWAEPWGTQVAEARDKETQGDKQPKAAQQMASSRVPAIAVSLAALAVIGAATANSLPSFNRFSLPDFNQFSLPSFDRFSLPDFSRFSLPNFNRVAAPPPPNPAPVLVPDPVVRAGLRDIQSSQQQNADVLVSLTQSSATQQADLKRITRQLSLLTAQVSSLQNQVTPPLTTSSIPPSTTFSIPRPNPRARVVQASRKVLPPVLPPTLPPLPKPAGPVSVGGAPLSPAPGPGSDAS
jgi:uncharacterized coiled-coil protein SlyX